MHIRLITRKFCAVLTVALIIFSLPANATTPITTRTILCENPIGSSTYLPGGYVPADRAGTQDDGYSGVVRLTFRIGQNIELNEVVWIRDEERVSTSDVKEGGKILRGFANSEVKRFDVTWMRGTSVVILVKQLETEMPFVAYAEIKAGFGLDKLSSFLAQCTVVDPKANIEEATTKALTRVNEWRKAIDEAALETANAVDAATAVADNAVSVIAPPPKN